MTPDTTSKAIAMAAVCTDDTLIAQHLGCTPADVAALRGSNREPTHLTGGNSRMRQGENLGLGKFVWRQTSAKAGSRKLLEALHAYQRKHHPRTPWAMAELPE